MRRLISPVLSAVCVLVSAATAQARPVQAQQTPEQAVPQADPYQAFEQAVATWQERWESAYADAAKVLKSAPRCSGRPAIILANIKDIHNELMRSKERYLARWAERVRDQNRDLERALEAREPALKAVQAAVDSLKRDSLALEQKKLELGKKFAGSDIDALIQDNGQRIASLSGALEQADQAARGFAEAEKRIAIREKAIAQYRESLKSEKTGWEAYFDASAQRFEAACTLGDTLMDRRSLDQAAKR